MPGAGRIADREPLARGRTETMTLQVDHRFVVDAVSDAASSLSFWPQVKDDSELGPDEALRVLATWSHLDRFPPEDLDRDVVGEFNALVARDALTLLARFSCLTFIEDWLDEVERLDEAWDWIAENDAADEANLVAARLFRTLDQFSLACHASRKLLGDNAPSEQRADLDAIGQEIVEGEQLLREQPGIFLGAAALASGQLRQFREDLLDHDDRLWETTIKHQLLDGLLEERDAEPTKREVDELFRVARTIETPPLQKEQPAEILPLLRRFREEVESPDRTRRAAAAANGEGPGAGTRKELADRRVPIEGDPAVQVSLVPEVNNQGQWNGLDISLFGDQQNVGKYVKAILRSASLKEPRVISLESGVGTLFFDDELRTDQVDALRITLQDKQGRERLVLAK
jgi:hypothetical protein